MRMACDLDVNSDLTNFFVQNIGDEIEIVVEKKVNQRFKEKRYLSVDDVFAANTERIFYIKGKCKASVKREIRSMEVGINKVNCVIIFAKYSCHAGEFRLLQPHNGFID